MFPKPAERLRGVQRVLAMGLPEIAERSRQGASKWLEWAGMTRVRVRPPADAERLRGALRDRFFAYDEPADEVPLGDALLPAAREALLIDVDRICRGHFDLLGYRGLSFGNPIDWHLDPVNDKRSPCVHWSLLDPLDVAAVGDSKIVWELNRHQWLVRLGQAYRLTGDDRYAAVCALHLYAWMRDNPPGIGINWASSLELALRLIAWCWVVHLLGSAGEIGRYLLADLSAWAHFHAVHVERYLSYYFSPNTHLTGEALGLYYAGTVFRDHPRAGSWRNLATRILTEQIEKQVHDDGVFFEQSTCYQRYSIEIYLHFLILAARNHHAIAPIVADRVQAMLDALLSMQHPNGAMPQVGDADGGWILPLESRGPDDLCGVLAPAAAFFGRPDYAWAAGGPAAETYWLLGTSGQRRFEALAPSAPDRPPSALFVEGGYAVMRSGWDRNAHHLVFDVGPLGCRHTAGHGHADLLSVQCAAFGEPCVVDPGTGSYAGSCRDHFRGTAAHATVIVDGRGQAEPAGPFRWQRRPRARLRRWLSTTSYDLAEAEHDAYRALGDPVTHRRRVIFVKPRYWILVDDLHGGATHTVAVGFQLAPMEVVAGDAAWVRATAAHGRGLAIGAWSPAGLIRSIAEGATGPMRGWFSPAYGAWHPAPHVTYSVTAQLPLRIVSALVPLEHDSSKLPAVADLLACVASLES